LAARPIAEALISTAGRDRCGGIDVEFRERPRLSADQQKAHQRAARLPLPASPRRSLRAQGAFLSPLARHRARETSADARAVGQTSPSRQAEQSSAGSASAGAVATTPTGGRHPNSVPHRSTRARSSNLSNLVSGWPRSVHTSVPHIDDFRLAGIAKPRRQPAGLCSLPICPADRPLAYQ